MATNVAVLPRIERPMDITPESLPPELEEKLKAPLPPGAIKDNDRNPHLSSIKPAYVIERMNEVFGIGGYKITSQSISHEKVLRTFKKGQPGEYSKDQFVATVHATLLILKYGIHLENYGGSENDDLGDAFKGAQTDAFTKMCSYLGVGLDVYKGLNDKNQTSLPPCPNCGKQLRKDKDGDGYFCWKAKGGCGGNFNEDGLKAVTERKATQQTKPPQSTQQPRQQTQPLAPSADKITIESAVDDRKTDESGKLWMKVGDRTCVTMQPELKDKLKKAFIGARVEIMISPLTGSNGSTIYQIHKVIAVRAPEAGRA